MSHLFYNCSVGAVVRTDEYLLAIKDIREWTDKKNNIGGELIPYVEQVKRSLSIDQDLYQPPVARETPGGRIDGVCIPAVRFPRWMRCPGCGLLYYAPWKDRVDNRAPHCNECRRAPRLEQTPWVMVHPSGCLADVDWHYLAHRNGRTARQSQCPRDNSSVYLRIEANAKVRSQSVICTRCGARNSFRQGTSIPWGKTWSQPWIYEPPDLEDEANGEILAVNDVRIHDAMTASAIVIPPESRIKRGTPLDRLYCNSKKRREIDGAVNPRSRRAAVRRVAAEFGCDPRDIEKALEEINNGYPLYGLDLTQGLLFESEYKALCEPIDNLDEDEDFTTRHHTSAWKSLGADPAIQGRLSAVIKVVDRLVAVSRLRAILVLQGFSRKEGDLVPPDIEGSSRWLPGLEMFGEGVFFTLNEQILNKWEQNPTLQARTHELRRRKEHAGLTFEPEIEVTPRFLLMHTIAHIAIRQLEAIAGYPAASLQERLYCQAGKNPMSGILIYVAAPGKYGTLGGLEEQAEPNRFLKLMKSVFDHADWCSLDPVCSEHEGQGPNLLNRAACHSCALIPETACYYNRSFPLGPVIKI